MKEREPRVTEREREREREGGVNGQRELGLLFNCCTLFTIRFGGKRIVSVSVSVTKLYDKAVHVNWNVRPFIWL